MQIGITVGIRSGPPFRPVLHCQGPGPDPGLATAQRDTHGPCMGHGRSPESGPHANTNGVKCTDLCYR